MTMDGVPAEGLRAIGQIDGANALRFQAKQSGLTIATKLLASHTSGAPIVDDKGKFVGFISEFDLLGAHGKHVGPVDGNGEILVYPSLRRRSTMII